jgi:hypothetical protein
MFRTLYFKCYYACFNNDEQSLIPDNFCLGELGNVKGALVRAGWKALNYLYNLRRYTFTPLYDEQDTSTSNSSNDGEDKQDENGDDEDDEAG